MTNQISTQTITFNNQALITFEQNGKHYTAMKPICENIGLSWEAQLARIKRDDILNSTMIVMIIVAEDGKKREMVCLPIEYLNGWLFGIDVSRCKPEIRETLIKYKKECYQALHDYWFNSEAQPNLPLVIPNPSHQELLKLVMKLRHYAQGFADFQKSITSKAKNPKEQHALIASTFSSRANPDDSYLFVFKPNIERDLQEASDIIMKHVKSEF